jgi:foldase protein PrsA
MRSSKLWLVLFVAFAFMLVQCKGEEADKGKKKPPKKVKTEQPAAEKKVDESAEKTAEDKTEPAEGDPAEETKTDPEDGDKLAGDKAEKPGVKPVEATPEDQPKDEELTDTVVARVNEQAIDIKEYVERLKKLTKGKAVTKAMIKKTVVDRMINDELLRQETEKLGVTVTDEEVAAAMNMDMERYNKQKEAMGARVKAFQDRVSVRKLLQARGLLKEPTEDELKKEYERRFGLKIDAVTFPVTKDTTADEEAKLTEEAGAILAAAKEGVSLRAAVKDKKTPNGRRIIVKPMFIKKGDERHQELWKVANPLEEKTFGGPVKTTHGIVVFQLAKRIEPRKSFDEMKEKLAKSALNMKVAQAKHRLLEDLRKGASIEYLIEFTKTRALPQLRNLKGGRINPSLSPISRDTLRPSAPVRAEPAAKAAAPKAVIAPAVEPTKEAPAAEVAPTTAPTAAPAE